MLEVKNLTCGYGRLDVIRDLSLTVAAESVGLFGPNGAGKTTLINAILGFLKPRTGSVTFNGEDLTAAPPHETARRGIALVPQERELFPFMSVRDNLELGAMFIPGAAEKLEENLERVFSQFPILKERSAQLAGTMSGGQQRMLAIGRALMANPVLLVLDEPSLGLQPSIVSELYDILKEMKGEISVLVTEQNVRESLRAVDRGYVMENGAIALEGSAGDLAKDPHVERVYLGL